MVKLVRKNKEGSEKHFLILSFLSNTIKRVISNVINRLLHDVWIV